MMTRIHYLLVHWPTDGLYTMRNVSNPFSNERVPVAWARGPKQRNITSTIIIIIIMIKSTKAQKKPTELEKEETEK